MFEDGLSPLEAVAGLTLLNSGGGDDHHRRDNSSKKDTVSSAAFRPRTRQLIDQREEDGTVYAGVSPDTGKDMYATPADAPLTYTFNQAMEYAARLDAHGHQDWRVPTKDELN